MKKLLLLYIIVIPLMVSCSVKKSGKVELVIDTKSDFGSGAFWNHQTGEMIWLDISTGIINIYNPRTGNNKEMFLGQTTGAAVAAESGAIIAALEQGIYIIDPVTGTKRLIANPDTISDNRFVNGSCDPAGRFWTSTVNTFAKSGTGTLYRLDADSTIHKILDNVSIANGIVWSGSNAKMFHIDLPTRKVIAYDYDNATGEISNRMVAIEIPSEMGLPYGMTIDAKNNLWIAMYGGSAVTCWNSATGELLNEIKVPAKNVTSCTFGDADLGTLYITTARLETDTEDLSKYPHSGGVFKVRPGVYGVQSTFFNDESYAGF